MAFATVQEFADYMQTDVRNSAAEPALEAATSTIQTVTGQHFYLVTDDTVTVRGSDGVITLPQGPVRSVSALTTRFMGDTTETARTAGLDYVQWGTQLTWAVGGYTRLNSNPKWGAYGVVWPEYVTVTYTHGFDPIPADVKACCMALAAEQYSSPDGIGYESIEDYAWRRDDAGKTPASYQLSILARKYGTPVASLKVGR